MNTTQLYSPSRELNLKDDDDEGRQDLINNHVKYCVWRLNMALQLLHSGWENHTVLKMTSQAFFLAPEKRRKKRNELKNKMASKGEKNKEYVRCTVYEWSLIRTTLTRRFWTMAHSGGLQQLHIHMGGLWSRSSSCCRGTSRKSVPQRLDPHLAVFFRVTGFFALTVSLVFFHLLLGSEILLCWYFLFGDVSRAPPGDTAAVRLLWGTVAAFCGRTSDIQWSQMAYRNWLTFVGKPRSCQSNMKTPIIITVSAFFSH